MGSGAPSSHTVGRKRMGGIVLPSRVNARPADSINEFITYVVKRRGCLRNRMRETCTYGSVGALGSNPQGHPADLDTLTPKLVSCPRTWTWTFRPRGIIR